MVRQVQRLSDDRYLLRGEGFGVGCPKCEVIATYPDGLRYALVIARWSDREIEVRLPDLNRGESIKLAVQIERYAGIPVPVWLTPLILSPQPSAQKPWPPMLFEHRSDLKVGDRGEEAYQVGVPAPKCGARAWIYERAELRHVRQRFGEAQIVGQPAAPCIECAPVRVRWYHEPTGYLEFQVSILRRAIEGVCADRVR